MLRWLYGDDCGVALDTRHDPIVITTWYGSVTCALVDDYFGWSDATTAAALAAEQRLIHVVDLRHVGRPTALVHKRAIDHSNGDLAGEVRLATIVVAGPELGEVVRVTARMARQGYVPTVVATIELAIELGLLALRSARIPAPVGLTSRRYRAPTLESAR